MNKKNKDLMFATGNDNTSTPQDLFNYLNNIFNFDLDAAASNLNYKCNQYFTEEDNALIQDWKKYKSIFINPPYSTKLQDLFLKKAYEEYKLSDSLIIVMLLPSRTDTKRWHSYIMHSTEVWFVKGRIKFENNLYGAPFPSVIVIFDSKKKINSTIYKSFYYYFNQN